MTDLTVQRKITTIALVMAVLLSGAAIAEVPAKTGRTQVKSSLDKLPAACALLDDPEKRPLLDGVLVKLLVACGRTNELGRVRQAPAEEVMRGIDNATDVAVNDPSGDTAASTTQSETSMAVNEDTGTICAGYNDSNHYFASGDGFTGFSRSTDGGASFVDRGALGAESVGDPSIVWSKKDGTFYFGALHFQGLGLWKSTDDCQTFEWQGVMHEGFWDDKELLAIDNNPASPTYGRIHVVFTNYDDDAKIWAFFSTDGGQTWTDEVPVSPTDNVQGAWPAVAPNGDVYVGWAAFDGDQFSIEMARSADGGASYSTLTSPAANVVMPKNAAATTTCERAALKGNIRYLPSPQVMVGADAVLHVVYSYSPGNGDECDSFYRRSTDGGMSWGPEVRLHDDTTTSDQFFPTLSVGENNIVSATWYDRRHDPNNEMVDYYQAFSFDGGVTWESNERISDVSTPIYLDPDLATCYHGDYDTHIQTETHAITQWADDRNLAGGHNDPDVFAEAVPLSTDYLLSVDPAFIGVCAPDDGVTTVNVLQFEAFADPVDLAVSGVPSGATATFVPTQVTPPGSSEMTLSGTASVAPGSYSLTLTGTSFPGGIERSTTFAFELFNAIPGSVDLVAPADGASNQPWRPTFNWSGASQAVSYRLQVATEATFASPVSDIEGLSEFGYIPGADLAGNTRYYWRVRAVNACDIGAWSSVFSFVTKPPIGICGTGEVAVSHYLEDFESGAPGWTHESDFMMGYDTWAINGGIVGAHSGSQVYNAICKDELPGGYSAAASQVLMSPGIALPADAEDLTMQFWTYEFLEPFVSLCFDAGILEISTDGGLNWEQMLDPVLLTEPYDGMISTVSENPLMTLDGWCGQPQPWVRSVVDIQAYAGQTVRFRFNLGCDSDTASLGWDIDDFVVTSCVPDDGPIFTDGFESGSTSAWTLVVP
ncbi:MAG: hypothetical protein ABFS37_01030 [Acidobacteriota bacterium]